MTPKDKDGYAIETAKPKGCIIVPPEVSITICAAALHNIDMVKMGANSVVKIDPGTKYNSDIFNCPEGHHIELSGNTIIKCVADYNSDASG